MAFLRHVGKQGDRKVAIIFREVPGEPHMCLVVYTETLNQHIHDPLVACIESEIGQNSEHLAEALNRTYTKDGKIILQVLHSEGKLKKVNTETIVVTPAPNVKIKLNELNKMLDEMKMGEEAVKKLAKMDQELGIQSPNAVQKIREQKIMEKAAKQQIKADATVGLGDDQLAANLRNQAERMSREAKGLMVEAERLLKEAEALVPSKASEIVTEIKTTKTKKSSKKVTV